MADEKIIKALQRTRDDNGNLIPIFPMTSADMVYYDVDKQITVADKLDGGIVNGNSVTYNNIYEKHTDGGTGILKIDIPHMANNSIDINMSVSSGSYDKTHDMATYLTPVSDENAAGVGNIYVSEMSPNGSYIFTATLRNNVYSVKLYYLSGSVVTEKQITLNKITQPIRARFTKNSEYLLIYGIDGVLTHYIEVHRMTASDGATHAYTKTYPLTFASGGTGNVSYFDTCSFNGSEYILTNDPTSTTAFACFRVGTIDLIASTAISTPHEYTIANDFRISPNSLKIAILSADAKLIHCMGTVYGSGVFQFRATGADMDTYAWGSSLNGGTRVGTWTKFSFNSDSTKLYGTYTVGYWDTFRVCNVNGEYGQFEPGHSTIKEITLDTDVYPYDIGAKVFKPVPASSIYGTLGTTFDYVSAGTTPGSTAFGRYITPVVRGKSSASPTQSSITRTAPAGDITETAYIVPEQNVAWSDMAPSLSIPNALKDIHIHPSNGYGYGIIENYQNIAIIPVYIGTGRPNMILSTNPASVPIPSLGTFVDVSYDGSAIGYVDNSDTAHIMVRIGDRYIARAMPDSATNINNRVLGCRVIDNGEAIILIRQYSIELWKYNNGLYVNRPITTNNESPFPSFTGDVYFSPMIKHDSGQYTWTMLKTEEVSTNNVQLTTATFTYNSTGLSVQVLSTDQHSNTHIRIVSVAFNQSGNRIAIMSNDNTLATGTHRIFLYELVGSKFTYINRVNLLHEYYTPSMSRSYNNSVLIDIADNTSIYEYGAVNGRLRGITITWGTTQTYTSRPTSELSNLQISCLAMQHIPNKKLIFALSLDKLHAISYANSRLTLINSTNLGDIAAIGMHINESGDTGVLVREYSLVASIMHIEFGNMSGVVNLTGKYTDDVGWSNVTITSDNSMLDESTYFATDDHGEVIMIGTSDTVWDPLNIIINTITISGENVANQSYRIGYDATIIPSLDGISNLTTDTIVVSEQYNTQRIYVKGYVIERDKWLASTTASGFYVYKIELPQITSLSTVSVQINDLTSWLIANDIGMLNIAIEHEGYVEIFAGNIPATDITVDIDILK